VPAFARADNGADPTCPHPGGRRRGPFAPHGKPKLRRPWVGLAAGVLRRRTVSTT